MCLGCRVNYSAGPHLDQLRGDVEERVERGRLSRGEALEQKGFQSYNSECLSLGCRVRSITGPTLISCAAMLKSASGAADLAAARRWKRKPRIWVRASGLNRGVRCSSAAFCGAASNASRMTS